LCTPQENPEELGALRQNGLVAVDQIQAVRDLGRFSVENQRAMTPAVRTERSVT
jgi:hypothetical protein